MCMVWHIFCGNIMFSFFYYHCIDICMRSKFHVALLLIATMACFSSCMTVRTPVGGYEMQQGTPYLYASGKQFWLFWGLIPIGHTAVKTPLSGTCMVITKHNLVDYVITSATYGFITSATIKVEAKK